MNYKKSNFEIVYKKIDEPDFSQDYPKKILKEVKKRNISEISMYEIEDKEFEKNLLSKIEKEVNVNYIQSPMFLNSRSAFKEYLGNVKKPFMANFYKNQRIKNKILVDDDDKPIGGKWSFDEENRKLPKEIDLPKKIFTN